MHWQGINPSLSSRLTCRFLYDGVVESQFYMMFDSNKRLLSSGDTYPEEVQLGKGDLVVRFTLRHDDPDLLDKLKALPLVSGM